MGVEPTRPAWKAGALPLSYARMVLPIELTAFRKFARCDSGYKRALPGRRDTARQLLVGRRGFEPLKAEPPDLQSGPFDRSGICPCSVVLMTMIAERRIRPGR